MSNDFYLKLREESSKWCVNDYSHVVQVHMTTILSQSLKENLDLSTMVGEHFVSTK